MKLHLIWLTVRHSKFLVLIPIVMAYLLLPLLEIGCLFGGMNADDTAAVMTYAIETLLPISGVLMGMAYLHLWIETDGEEAMRASAGHSHTCAIEILILTLIFLAMLLPTFMLFAVTIGNLWDDYIRVSIQVLFFGGVFYTLAILFHSVAMGSMVVLAYHLFCVMFSRHAEIHNICLIRPDLAGAETSDLFPVLFLCSLAAFGAGAAIERLQRKY